MMANQDFKPLKPVSKLINMVEKSATKARAKAAEHKVQVEAGKDLVMQMTLFPDDSRAIPNYLARSPLFSTVPATLKQRPAYKDMLLPSPKGFEIRYSGEQLDQSDCDIFMQIIHESSGHTIRDDKPLLINRAECLKRTGRNDSGQNYIWLKEVVERLRDAKIVLESERYKYSGNLIREIIEDKQERHIAVTLSPAIVQMFSGNEYTLVDWEKRKRLKKRVNLSKWLQNFICSHEKGLQRHSIDNLRTWFGYSSPVRKFREAMTDAMQELERVGIIAGAAFYDDDAKVKWHRL
jgi:hypothetical protein